MLLLKEPSREQIENLLAAYRQTPFTYPDVGASSGAPPAGWRVDHNRVRLGTGQALFERARAGFDRWAMFEVGWMRLCWPSTPLAAGSTVALLASLPGLWSLNLCRVVYTIDDDDGRVRRRGFAYGTLGLHEASGEERFLLEWDRADDSVHYDVLAFSRPYSWLARLGYPVARLFQRRFGRASKRAMLQCCAQQ